MSGDVLSKKQESAHRQLGFAAYLASLKSCDEQGLREGLAPYASRYESALEKSGDAGKAKDAFRKMLAHDVAALQEAGVFVEVEERQTGRIYRLPPEGLSPVEIELTDEERAVLLGALGSLQRGFPYEGPLRLAVTNLIGTAARGTKNPEGVVAALFAQRRDDEVADRVGKLEEAISRRKRVRFVYYSIGRDEESEREIKPYVLLLIEGVWYVTGRDANRDALRQFRLDRMRGSVSFSTKSERGDFPVPEDLERRLFKFRAPWQLGGPGKPLEGTARIRLAEGLAEALLAPYRWAGEVEEGEGDAVFVTPYQEERQLASWVLSLGEGVQALSPPSLVEGLRCALGRLLEAHEGEISPEDLPKAHLPETERPRDKPLQGVSSGYDPTAEGVRPEKLALEVALARFVARMPEGEEIPLAELAEAFGSTEEKIGLALRPIVELEDSDEVSFSGVYVESGRLVKALEGTYEKDFRRPLRLSGVQARAVLLALDLVLGAADPLIVEGLREKIRAAAGPVRGVETAGSSGAGGEIGVAVGQACREGRVLELRYPSKGGRAGTREVEPLSLVCVEGRWYLDAYCRAAEDYRLFRLERILGVRILEERFAERARRDLTGYEDIDPRRYATRRAVVRFSPEVARWMRGRREMDHLADREDGSADYVLHHKDVGWAARRVMRYRGEAVALEPDDLRREISRRARTLLVGYDR